jgi:hypothetical protein
MKMSELVINKMNPEVKTKWLEALRSGRFAQTRGKLHRKNDGYCCLGVLAEVLGCTWQTVEGKNDGDQMFPFLDGINEAKLGTIDQSEINNILGDTLLQKAALKPRQQSALAEMNDNGRTFAEIADYIEATL